MANRLEGKVALVTGGTGGIGEGAVRRLSVDGAKVIFTGSRQEAADPICADTGATFVSHRVQDAAAWTSLSDRIRRDFGRQASKRTTAVSKRSRWKAGKASST